MKIAFVPPWYGKDIPGGAEALVRSTAEHLHNAGMPIEILTTTVKDFHSDWGRNHHRAQVVTENGVPVRRFPVRRRNRAAFDEVNWKLMHGQPVTRQEEQIYLEENIRSPTLEQYIATHTNDYVYVFIPYLFGTTYWGIRACKGKGLMIPCLHDEPYARMSAFQELFRQVPKLILLAAAERELMNSLYGLPDAQSVLIGAGLDTDWTANAHDFLEKYGLTPPFILYAGRKSQGKNVDILVDYFRRYRRSHERDVDLVLIGSGSTEDSWTQDSRIHDLGFVPAQDKHNAYAAATILCQPSLHESFSLVIMEAWLAGTPVLVHGACEVTKEHCIQSNGGLYFSNYAEFEVCLDLLLEHKDLNTRLGANGRRYVLQNYSWDTITERYRRLFENQEAL